MHPSPKHPWTKPKSWLASTSSPIQPLIPASSPPIPKPTNKCMSAKITYGGCNELTKYARVKQLTDPVSTPRTPSSLWVISLEIAVRKYPVITTTYVKLI